MWPPPDPTQRRIYSKPYMPDWYYLTSLIPVYGEGTFMASGSFENVCRVWSSLPDWGSR